MVCPYSEPERAIKIGDLPSVPDLEGSGFPFPRLVLAHRRASQAHALEPFRTLVAS